MILELIECQFKDSHESQLFHRLEKILEDFELCAKRFQFACDSHLSHLAFHGKRVGADLCQLKRERPVWAERSVGSRSECKPTF